MVWTSQFIRRSIESRSSNSYVVECSFIRIVSIKVIVKVMDRTDFSVCFYSGALQEV